MWHLPTPLRKRFEARTAPARRPRRYRPRCTALEVRHLLSVNLTPTAPPVPLVGAPVIWTATSTGHGTTPVYQFSVGQAGGALHMVRDFSAGASFTWNPMQEGTYDIQVTVKDSFSSTTGESATATYTAQSRIVGNSAVISPMSNPLVALFSAPPSPGPSMDLEYAQQGPSLSWLSTAPQPIVPGESTNFIVAGMLPHTTYLMRFVLNDGTTSAPLAFTTGSLPTNLAFPTFTQVQVAAPDTDLTQNIIYHEGLTPPPGAINTLATDLQGDVVWYYDSLDNNFNSYSPTLVPGGTALLLGGKPIGPGGGTIVREIDLAGDPLRETNSDAVNAELAAMGQPSITGFSHDLQRLPNGDTAVLAYTQRTIDVNGTPTTYTGDMVVVLNQNFQVVWNWDPFKWLNTSRLGTDGEGPNDWLHANSIAWSPEDGDLIVSLRAQDWVIKIHYDNGAGDGHVVWTLGQGGNFTITDATNPSDPYPWFTHQHDVRYIDDSTIVLFDDGNTRHDTTPYKDSRGQELVLNETTMTATLVVNADLGNYSGALGSAQMLPNGNLDFTSGIINGSYGQSIEVLPDGTKTYVQQMPGLEYRSYFMSTLYGSPANLYNSGFEDQPLGTGRYQYDPTGSAWGFGGSAGLAGNGSAFTSGNPNAPQGSQVAFLQGTGTISQAVDFYSQAGAYTISFSAAQRRNDGTSREEVEVLVDGHVVGTFTPASTSYATYTTAAFNATAGNHTISFVGVDPSGADYTALLDGVGIDNLAPPAPSDPDFVDLSSAFNRQGIVADGATFAGGGLDGDGNALSSSLVGTSLTTLDAAFNLGPAGAKDVVSAAGQTIALSPGNDAALKLLATAVNGARANQVFTVTYTDGTTATLAQSISDWAIPRGFAGEATALATGYRDKSGGTEQAGPYRIYEYTLALDPTRVVKSLTLPKDANVEVLAAELVPAGTTQVALSSAYNRTGIVADGSTFGGGGLDGDGNALSSSLVGTGLTAGGAIFNFGPSGANDVVSAAGQTIALPVGRDSALKLLATAVNGARANQVFTVTYTDGTTATLAQSISDWAIPRGFAGEATALATGYRDTSGGTEQGGPFNVYEYTLALDPTRVVKSLTLPKDANVEVLAATLIPASTTRVALSSAFNREGIVADGAPFAGGGLDGDGNALSSSLVGTGLTVGGDTFDLGPSGADDVVSAAGQTIALPSGKDSALKLLATAVNGAQANQVFTVAYTDGTTATLTQSISDWAIPRGFAGEATALATGYRDTSAGGQQAGPYRIYEYTLALDPTRVVKSLTLPKDANVEVLAIDVLP